MLRCILVQCTYTNDVLTTASDVAQFFSASLPDARRFAIYMANSRLGLKLRYPITERAALDLLRQNDLLLKAFPCTLEQGQEILDGLAEQRREREAAFFASFGTQEDDRDEAA